MIYDDNDPLTNEPHQPVVEPTRFTFSYPIGQPSCAHCLRYSADALEAVTNALETVTKALQLLTTTHVVLK